MSIYLIIGLLLAFLMRVGIIYLNRSFFIQGFVGDSSVHFAIIQNLKSILSRGYIEKYVIRNKFTYPILFHRYSQIFPESSIKRHSYLPNLFLFMIGVTIYTALLYFTFVQLLNLNEFYVLFALGFFCLSASNFIFQGPAVAYIKLSERFFARFSTSLYYFSQILFLIYHEWIFFVISCIFCSISILSSKFARQVVLLSLPFISIAYLSAFPFLIFVLGFTGAALLFRAEFLDSFMGGLKYLNIYGQFVKKGKIAKTVLSSFLSPQQVWQFCKSRQFKACLSHLRSKEPSRSIFFYPELYLLIFLLFLRPDINIIRSITPILMIYFLTSSKYMNHLGEAYRYIEYGLYYLLPFEITLLISHLNSSTYLPFISAYGLFTFAFVLRTYYEPQNYPEQDLLAEFLSPLNLTREDVIYPISMRLGADICARTDCPSFWWQPGGITDPNQYQEYIEEYPYLKVDWHALFSKHKVTCVIANKVDLKRFHIAYNFEGLNKIHEDEYFIAFRVPPKV